MKTHKDYEREIKKFPEYAEYKKLLDKVGVSIKSLEAKEKELASFDWKMKGIIDIHKIQHTKSLFHILRDLLRSFHIPQQNILIMDQRIISNQYQDRSKNSR